MDSPNPPAGIQYNDDGTRIECNICHRWVKSLGSHSALGHDVTAAEYRVRFGLSPRQSLDPPARQQARREAAIKHKPGAKRTQKYACINCGAAAWAKGGRCPACRAKHRTAKKLLAKKRKNPPPKPIPQRDGGLPPIGLIIADDDGERIQCHVCGEFKRSVASHARLSHGMTADYYKEQFGIARTRALISPVTQQRQRASQLARGIQPVDLTGMRGVRPVGVENRLDSRVTIAKAQQRRRARHQ